MKKIAVLTSGGDAPGMNAAIRSVIRMAGFLHCEIVGIHRGYSGLLEEDFRLLTNRDAGGIVLRGGTMLRTARCPAFFDEDNQKKGAQILKNHGIEGLVVIGGDGSVQGAAVLSSLGIPTVTIPGTIDNDMHGTDETIGHDTAVNAVVGAVSRIRDTASAHDRAAIIEVMGRFAGNIALDAGIACGAEYILVPEVPFSREKLARSLIGQMKEGRTNSIIICAEGADDGRALGDWLKERTNIDICTTILGFIQRGGRPSARDSILGSLLGAAAVKALLDGQITSLIGMNKGEIRILPYSEAAKEKKLYNGKQSYKMEDGYIKASSLFRSTSTSKNSRTNLSSSAERIVRFIKTQYPKERQTFISFCINPLKFSYGYYIYTLRRILI